LHFHALRPVPANIPPTVSITSPANNATFTAPAAITLTANAVDTDGTITKVEFFHGGTTLIATVTAAPYTFNWTNVAAASYTLTAKATDNQNGTITSAPVNVTVNTAVAQLYYIHTDHLDTPRAISNATGQEVWRWDHTEPFGADMANGNPSGLGAFEFKRSLLPSRYTELGSWRHDVRESHLEFCFESEPMSRIVFRLGFVAIGLALGLAVGGAAVWLRSIFDPPLSRVAVILVIAGFGVFGLVAGAWEAIRDHQKSKQGARLE
jgi:hypothetical protein